MRRCEDLAAPAEQEAWAAAAVDGWEVWAQDQGGNCACPKCGRKASHQQGRPCYQVKCPNCGTPMPRDR